MTFFGQKKLGLFTLGLMLLSLIINECTQPPTSEKHMLDSAVITILATDARLQVSGRTQALDDGGLRFGYPGVSVKFNTSGRSASLQAYSSSDQSYLEIIVDDEKPRAVKLSSSSQTIPLFNDPQPGNHQVEVIHRSETWHGVVTLENLTIEDGQFLPVTDQPKRRMLILGDSVTCGEAIERVPECQKDTSWWNPRLSYGLLTAASLDAQAHLVCYGGRGLVRTWDGKTTDLNLPDFFELAIPDQQPQIQWDHSQYSPDLILSAIGTNDFSIGIPDREQYVNTYVSLIDRLLALHPNAQIILTEGAILDGDKKARLRDYLAEAKSRVNDSRVHVVSSKHYPGDDCDAHPTKAQHAAMANDLTPLLREIMGWK